MFKINYVNLMRRIDRQEQREVERERDRALERARDREIARQKERGQRHKARERARG